MCEHEWITTRAVYRESVVDGYKNHEINRRVCIICLKTKDEIDLERQLAAANARITELEATLKEIAKGNIVYPDLFAQQSLKDTKNSGCPYGVLPSKRCCKVCNELENMLFKCNQEIVKQACKTEQLQQQLVAANHRAEQAEAQAAAETK